VRNDPALEVDLERWEAALASGDFEDAFTALEESVACLESGRLSLEGSLRCFELGAQLAERCDRMLAEAELRVSRLDDVLARIGRPSELFDDDVDGFDE